MIVIRNFNSRKMTRTFFILVFAFIGIVNCANAQVVDKGTCGDNLKMGIDRNRQQFDFDH